MLSVDYLRLKGARTQVISNAPGSRISTHMMLSQISGLAWLGLIGFLLTLNFKGFVVGASVGCGFRFQKNCVLDPFAADPFAELKRLDLKDHNILGGLQFVAKALEVWFVLIAASLVYHLTMLLAARVDGLPIGFLMSNKEYSDIMTLKSWSFWRAANPNGSRAWFSSRSVLLYAFAMFVALLSIAANLMGPAAAVLVLPTLGWNELQLPTEGKFLNTAVADPPVANVIAIGCDDAAPGNYTCMQQMYSEQLDELSASLSAAWNQSQQHDGSLFPAVLQESSVNFPFNYSQTDQTGLIWSPNRQVMRLLSEDIGPYSASSTKDNTFTESSEVAQKYERVLYRNQYDAYRNNLQAIFHRQGPVLGSMGGCSQANLTEIPLSENKSVRCYNYTVTKTLSIVKCIQIGSGWQDAKTEHSQFSIGDTNLRSAGSVSVDIYAVNKSPTYESQEDWGCVPDLNTLQTQGCDWDRIFTSSPIPDDRNSSLSQQIFEYNVPSLEEANQTVVCVNVAFFGFSDYSIDTSQVTNSDALIGLNIFSNTTAMTPIYLHPDWNLAAWSTTRSGTVNSNRVTAQNILTALKNAVNSPIPANESATYGNTDMNLFTLQHNFITLQALSLVNYNTTTDASTASAKFQDPLHPTLRIYAQLHVWAYGISLRTSKVGIAVALFGCVCVVLHSIISFAFPVSPKSLVELFVTAMEHTYEGEFEGLEEKTQLAKVRFRIRADDKGGFAFMSPEQGFGAHEMR